MATTGLAPAAAADTSSSGGRQQPLILRVKRKQQSAGAPSSLLVKRPRLPLDDVDLPVDNQAVNQRFVHTATSRCEHDPRLLGHILQNNLFADASAGSDQQKQPANTVVKVGLVVQREEGDDESAAGPSAKRPRSFYLDAVQQQNICLKPAVTSPAQDIAGGKKSALKRSSLVSGPSPQLSKSPREGGLPPLDDLLFTDPAKPPASNKKAVQFGAGISCNGQPAVALAAAAAAARHDDYVYDYYVLEQASAGSQQQPAVGQFSRADDFGELHGYYDDKVILLDDELMETQQLQDDDDSDSNAEDNCWRNEYPDESDSGAASDGGSDNDGFGHSASITRAMQRMQLAGLQPADFTDAYFGGCEPDDHFAHLYAEPGSDLSDVE